MLDYQQTYLDTRHYCTFQTPFAFDIQKRIAFLGCIVLSLCSFPLVHMTVSRYFQLLSCKYYFRLTYLPLQWISNWLLNTTQKYFLSDVIAYTLFFSKYLCCKLHYLQNYLESISGYHNIEGEVLQLCIAFPALYRVL